MAFCWASLLIDLRWCVSCFLIVSESEHLPMVHMFDEHTGVSTHRVFFCSPSVQMSPPTQKKRVVLHYHQPD